MEQTGRETSNYAIPRDVATSLAAARRGDSEAFKALTQPHHLELLTHCYRMLGSLEDAEDQVQETLLRAWRRLETYEGRAPFRAWLYKIATHACLDALEHKPRRTLPLEPEARTDLTAPPPQPKGTPIWIQPFPEQWLAPTSSSPEARYDAYESISLAFLVALQVLPPRQRAVLIFKDVLDWSMAEIAGMLGISLSSATSLMHRARQTMKQRNLGGRQDASRMRLPDDHTRQMLDQFVRAWETADIDGIVALLTDDAVFPMPPLPACFRGKAAIRAFIETIYPGDVRNRWKLLPVRANGKPAYAFYRLDELTQTYQPFALQVLMLKDGLVSDATTFGYPQLFRFFNLPEQL